MIRGNPDARMVKFLLTPGTTRYLPGDGLLPSDLDGTALPPDGSPNYFVGTMDDGAGRGTPFDGINVFQFSVTWSAHPSGPSLWLLSCRSPRSTRSSHAPHQPELYPPTQDGQQGGHP